MVAKAETRDQQQPAFEPDFVKEFMVQRQGKWVVLYAGLLHLAHKRGLVGIETEMLQYPTADNGNTAIARARVMIEQDGKIKTFTGIGDANPGNVAKPMAIHTVRMSETRAKSRALRDAVDVGVAALEELAEGEEGVTKGPSAPSGAEQPQQSSRTTPAARLPVYVALQIGDKQYQVPKEFEQLTERDHHDYAFWVEKIWAAKDVQELGEIAKDLRDQAAILPEPVYQQLVRVGQARKKKLMEAADGNRTAA